MTSNATIPVALCVSLALHGGALAMIDRMPRGWQLAEPGPARFGAGVLQTRLRAEAVETLTLAAKPASRPVVPVAVATAKPAPRPAFGAVAPPLYLPANELDEKPLIRTHVEPQFPAGAPVSEGRVVLRLYIAETGSIDEIAVVRAEPSQVFEESARRAFAGASFTPGRKNGEPVKSELTIELLFGAPVPVAQTKLPEGPQWQLPRRAANSQSRKEMP